VNPTPSLGARLVELDARGARLLRLRTKFALIGVTLLTAGFAVWWPDPEAADQFTTFVRVPEPLFSWLKMKGAAVSHPVGWAVAEGSQIGWAWVPMAPVFWLLHCGLRRLIPSRSGRAAITIAAVLGSPFWLGGFLGLFSGGEAARATAARTGVIVDHDGAPPAIAHLYGDKRVAPYRLRPERLSQPLADQAHYVLAQQAYLDGDRNGLIAHLDALAAGWRPEGADRNRLGMMASFARAQGFAVRRPLMIMTRNAPHAQLRRLTMYLLLVTAGLLIGAAVLCDVEGRGRRRRSKYLSELLSGLAPVEPATSQGGTGFGRRCKPLAAA